MSALSEKLDLMDGNPLETVSVCPLCSSGSSTFLFWNFDRLYHLPGKFGTYRCDECGLVRLSPRPTVETIGRHYPADYGAYNTTASIHSVNAANQRGVRGAVRNAVLSTIGYGNSRSSIWQRPMGAILSPFFYRRATYNFGDLFPNFVEGGRALEVGCGNGGFLSFLKYHGWSVAGVDLSPIAAQRAKELFDIDVFNGQLEDAPFTAESFDFIRLSHVLEHTYDPLQSLKKIFTLLKPGGIVYIEVPNAIGVGAEIYGEYWFGFDAPRHLFMFTPENLQLALERAGLQLFKLRTILWDSFDWAMTFKYEEETGDKLEERPTVRADDRQALEDNKSKARSMFNADPLSGDLICSWSRKPSG